ncbi:MAG: hypothetical protein HYZ30_01050 [Candidatus Azosocius agrarius]|nr:MAG: hypothetical protein HYZ30_01050 [Gammaproteobacteria bacterium]
MIKIFRIKVPIIVSIFNMNYLIDCSSLISTSSKYIEIIIDCDCDNVDFILFNLNLNKNINYDNFFKLICELNYNYDVLLKTKSDITGFYNYKFSIKNFFNIFNYHTNKNIIIFIYLKLLDSFFFSISYLINLSLFVIFGRFGLNVNEYILKFNNNIKNLYCDNFIFLELYLLLFGGCIFTTMGIIKQCFIPKFTIFIINCNFFKNFKTNYVKKIKFFFFKKNFLKKLNILIYIVNYILINNDLFFFKKLAMLNNKLLISIGIIPDKMFDFIKSIEFVEGIIHICKFFIFKNKLFYNVIIIGDLNKTYPVIKYYEFIVEKCFFNDDGVLFF